MQQHEYIEIIRALEVKRAIKKLHLEQRLRICRAFQPSHMLCMVMNAQLINKPLSLA